MTVARARAVRASSLRVAATIGRQDRPGRLHDRRHDRTLLPLLLAISFITAALALLPTTRGARAWAGRRGLARLPTALLDRVPGIQSRRPELAGVSVACLLLALLITAGVI